MEYKLSTYSKTILPVIILILTIFQVPSVNGSEPENIKWEIITENGFGNEYNGCIRGAGIYKGELYVGTQSCDMLKTITIESYFELIQLIKCTRNFGNIIPFINSQKSHGCELWKYNYSTKNLKQIVGNLPEADIVAGFGDILNFNIGFTIEFKNNLYVGTRTSPMKGCEIWRYNGTIWEKVIEGGFGDPSNVAAWCSEIFKDYLYVGTVNFNNSNTGYCQIWRTFDGESWEKIIERGFRDFDGNNRTHNIYAWSMKIYNNSLYVGTNNQQKIFGHNGCQLYKTSDGENWSKVQLPGGDGFGEQTNNGISSMEVYDGWLYVGTAILKHDHGFEIWKYNGDIWIPVIGDDVLGVKKWAFWDSRNDGFGDNNNFYAYCMLNCSDKLWVGTVNTKGCELYCYDKDIWQEIVGSSKDCEKQKGFNSNIIGFRTMIEYPVGSGNIVFGTLKATGNHNSCHMWIRKN